MMAKTMPIAKIIELFQWVVNVIFPANSGWMAGVLQYQVAKIQPYGAKKASTRYKSTG
jgi:hypothetical protein